MRIRSILMPAAMLLLAASVFAEGTRLWTQSSYDDFEKGTANGVAVASDGTLFLAPSFRALTTTPSTYLWSIASDAEGNVYAAAGSPARVYRIAPDGITSVIFQPAELQVQSVAVAPDGTVFAATSPDGKVYRLEHGKGQAKAGQSEGQVDPAWKASVYFDPNTKYIWDLALAPNGDLYVATGDHGQIFKVDKRGKGSVFFTSDEAHIRVLALDNSGNLIAGSDGSGLVYRIAPNGNAFVLYSADKKEITALAVDSKGNIYAAGVGDKKTPPQRTPAAPGQMMLPAPAQTPMPGTAPAGDSAATPTATKNQPGSISLPGAMVPMAGAPFAGAGGSEIYRIAVDGTPQRIWDSDDDLVYALAFDAQGDLVVGTGNTGHIFAIRNQHEFADLVKASANQVIAFAHAPNGGIYVGTSNLAKVFTLGAQPDAEGTFESDVFDAKIFSRWGRAEVRADGLVDLYARSGNVDNPDRNWSPWQKVDLAKGAALNVPSARFVQWRVALRPGLRPAAVQSIAVNYRPNNVPPVVDNVSVQVGYRYLAPPRQPGLDAANIVPVLNKDKSSVAVRWMGRDADDDDLEYAIYYRGDGESQWKLLKSKLSERFCTFDASALPDGGYTLKVVASDAPSNSPDEAMSSSDQSAHFEIDNTPPVVAELYAVAEGDHIQVTFHANDSYSPIKRAEYSVDGGDWQFIEPVGLLSDNVLENYDFTINLPPAPGETGPAPAVRSATMVEHAAATTEHSVVVRVYDRFENMGSAKAVVRTR